MLVAVCLEVQVPEELSCSVKTMRISKTMKKERGRMMRGFKRVSLMRLRVR
jgi:hypothetical protein